MSIGLMNDAINVISYLFKYLVEPILRCVCVYVQYVIWSSVTKLKTFTFMIHKLSCKTKINKTLYTRDYRIRIYMPSADKLWIGILQIQYSSTDCRTDGVRNLIHYDLSFFGIVPVAIIPMNRPVIARPITLPIIAPLSTFNHTH